MQNLVLPADVGFWELCVTVQKHDQGGLVFILDLGSWILHLCASLGLSSQAQSILAFHLLKRLCSSCRAYFLSGRQSLSYSAMGSTNAGIGPSGGREMCVCACVRVCMHVCVGG